MVDFFKQPARPPVSRRRRLAQLALVLLLLTLATLFIEHWRGERALRAWKIEMTARGEIFNPNQLWPATVSSGGEFSDQLAGAVDRLPQSLDKFSGILAGLSQDELGRPRRGSKEDRPPRSFEQNNVSTWQELESASQAARPALKILRKLMQDPPTALGGEIAKRLDHEVIPNFSRIRRASQALHAATINDLHRGDLEAALENLEAMQGCVRLHADEPTLVNYMIRVALLGLSSDACWDALQENGWTEPQLARLQKACQSNALFSQIPNVMAGERAARLHSMNWLASHRYQAWIDRYADLYKLFGSKPAELDTANWHGRWRQWIFHPTWSYAWRAQEELDYLKYSQQDLDILREAVQRGSWVHLQKRQAELRDNYRRPPAAWRFYGSLPLHDSLSEIIGGPREERPECPYPNFSKAWFVTARNLTQHEMVRTAIALKRHQLREGQLPCDLAALVPACLDAVPRDLVDGQPLRYRPNPDGTFVLYSVGENARDEGGDSRPSELGETQRRPDSWSGRDWVWPQISTSVKKPGT